MTFFIEFLKYTSAKLLIRDLDTVFYNHTTEILISDLDVLAKFFMQGSLGALRG